MASGSGASLRSCIMQATRTLSLASQLMASTLTSDWPTVLTSGQIERYGADLAGRNRSAASALKLVAYFIKGSDLVGDQ